MKLIFVEDLPKNEISLKGQVNDDQKNVAVLERGGQGNQTVMVCRYLRCKYCIKCEYFNIKYITNIDFPK